jgi:hypothetical protein
MNFASLGLLDIQKKISRLHELSAFCVLSRCRGL